MRKTTILLILIAFSSFAMGQEYFTEDFEAGTLPTGWSIVTNATDGGYLFGTADELSNSFWPIPDNGGKIAVTNDKNCNCDKSNDLLITSEFDLSSTTAAFVGFDYKFDQYENSGIISVSYSLDGGSSWNGFKQVSETVIPPTGADWKGYNINAPEITGKSNVMLAFKYNDENKWNYGLALDNIKVFKPIKLDVEFESLNIVPNAKVGDDVNVEGTITNLGSDTIKSVTLTWTDGTNTNSQTVTGISIAPLTEYSFLHETKFSSTSADDYTITVTVENPNGVADEDDSNNSKSSKITIYEPIVRTVLVEEFSTEKCPQCPPVAIYLHEIAEANDSVIMMVHHAGYYTDRYTIPENEELLKFYNNEGRVFAPAAMMDRHYNGLGNDGSDANPGPVFWPGDPYGGTRIDDRLEQPAFVNVNISGEIIEEDSIKITVDGLFIIDYTDDLGVSLWIIEDGITSTTQAGFTGTWTHHSLVRDAISETFGNPITTSTNKDDKYSMTFSYKIDTNWVFENLSLIAFVNTIDSDNVNNRSVQNAGSIKVSDLTLPVEGKDVVFMVTDANTALVDAKVKVGTDSVLTNTDGSATISFTESTGTFNYSVTKENYLDATGEFDLSTTDTVKVSLSPVGIDDNQLNLVKFYPNPFNNTLTIENLENASQVIVSNILGQTVKTVNELGSKVVISTHDLGKGVYFISVRDINNNVRTEKVVKQ